MAYVALDYGHGEDTFNDHGSKGLYEDGRPYEEHWFNADVGEQVRHILEEHGVKVLVTQPPYKDDVGLNYRTNLANRENVDLFFSIHANAGVPAAQGACAFAWEGYPKANEVADLVVKNLKEQGIDLHGNGRHYSRMYYPNSTTWHWTNFHVLRETNMSAVLVEHGFMTNDRDFENIFGKNKKDYRRRCAIADAKAILEYFNIEYKGGSTIQNEEELNMKQYEELKKEIASLKRAISSKADERPLDDEAWDSHADSWKWLEEQGITNGKDPHLFISREQMATMLKRFYENNEKLPDWMYDEIVNKFDGIAPHLKNPDEWKEKLSKHEVPVSELLGVFMLAFLNKETSQNK